MFPIGLSKHSFRRLQKVNERRRLKSARFQPYRKEARKRQAMLNESSVGALKRTLVFLYYSAFRLL